MFREPQGGGILFPIRWVGSHAQKALESGLSWKMEAVFQKGFYCRNQAGERIFFSQIPLGAGPLSALCDVPGAWDWREWGLGPDTEIRSEGHSLRVSRFRFSYEKARRWQAGDLAGRWDQRVMRARMELLSCEAARRSPLGGLGGLISLWPGTREDPPETWSPLLRLAWKGIHLLYCRLCSGFSTPYDGPLPDRDREALQVLVGLGPGLTPSGDDLLGGVMITLHALGKKRLAGTLAHAVLDLARLRTNEISRAHLACAAEGQGAEALHRAISALCLRDAPEPVRSLERMALIGATSGWDALAGVFLVLKAIMETRADAPAAEGLATSR